MTAPVRTMVRLRVTVVDNWQVCPMEVRKNDSVGEVKRRALVAAHIDPARAGAYEVKYGGALVRDEARTLADERVPDDAALVVLASRRRAVR